jgi:BolA protein
LSAIETLRSRIEAQLQPERLEIINESHLHSGHQEKFDGSGETHLRVRVVSARFSGMSRVARHRLVNDLAAPEIAAGLHALAIEARAPEEAAR